MKPLPLRSAVIERLMQIYESSPYKTKTAWCESLGISPQILGNLLHPSSERDIPKSVLAGVARQGYNTQWLLYGIGGMRSTKKLENEEKQLLLDRIKHLESLLANTQKLEKLGVSTAEPEPA
jgi:hypothetical protein